MNRHLLIVANGFRAVGLLVGVPSLMAFLWLTSLKLQLMWLKPDKSVGSGEVNIGRDGIVGVVAAIAIVIGKGFELAGDAVNWISGVLDVFAVVLTVMGACLFLTGRGLVVHAMWARLVAGLLTGMFLLISFLAMTSLKRGAPFALLPVGASIYMLWVLIRRFS